MIEARKAIKHLMETNPEALADRAPSVEQKPIVNLSEVNDMTPPSELARLGKELAKKRLSAEPPTDVELEGIFARIGKSRRDRR